MVNVNLLLIFIGLLLSLKKGTALTPLTGMGNLWAV